MRLPTPAEFPSYADYLVAFKEYHLEHDALNKALAKEMSKSVTRDREPLRNAVHGAAREVRKHTKQLAELKAQGHFEGVRVAVATRLLKGAVARRDERIEALARFDLEIGRAPPAPKEPPKSPVYGIPPERKAELRALYPHIKFYDEA